MKWLVGLVLCVCAVAIWVVMADRRAHVGTTVYRMTVQIKTPDGIMSGSSVVEAMIGEGSGGLPEARGVRGRLKGEAVFVDLGGGKNVIALIDDGWAFLPAHVFKPGVAEGWREQHLLSSKREIPVLPLVLPGSDFIIPLLPRLVSFTDINDPASARIIHQTGARNVGFYPNGTRPKFEPAVLVDRINETFGPGYAFASATIEIVSAGTPVTRGIEGRLPVIMGKLRELDKKLQVSRPTDPFKVGSGHLSIP